MKANNLVTMSGRAALPLLALCIILSTGAAWAAEPGSLEAFTGRLDSRVPELLETYGVPGTAIALVRGGRTVWSGAYGYARVEAGRKMTPGTICRVESISKSVTAWGIMKLAGEGVIDLDAPVKDYLKSWSFPESAFHPEEITVRQLLTQTSGLPLGTIGVLYDPEGRRPTLRDQLSRDAVMRQEPGLSFYYSNTGYNILELLIEEVTGRSFAEYMRSEVLLPLGMYNASFEWSREWDPPVPDGHRQDGTPIPPYVYPDKASGGLFATVEDIAAFVAAGMGMNEPDIDVREMYRPQARLTGYYSLVFDGYGFGHFIEFLPDGRTAVSHGGQGSGWMTHFHSIPESGDAIVILTNSQNSWPFISRLLTDWAEWNGTASIGMGLIVRAASVLRMAIAALFLVLLLQVWRLAGGLASGRLRFSPFQGGFRAMRLAQVFFSAAILALLGRAVTMEYLFVTSVFPLLSPWLGAALLCTALVLLASALVTRAAVSRR